jgi:4-diphosphocytidyl-2-C-methyl-D-erythritol kinase
VGEQLQPLSLPPRAYVVIQPNCQISTREIFLHPGLTRHSTPITIARFLEVGGNNDCEGVVRVLYPEVDAALRWLSRWGLARMTGTGSCVYVEVVDEAMANEVLAEKPAEWFAFIAQGVNTSALHTELNKLSHSKT